MNCEQKLDYVFTRINRIYVDTYRNSANLTAIINKLNSIESKLNNLTSVQNQSKSKIDVLVSNDNEILIPQPDMTASNENLLNAIHSALGINPPNSGTISLLTALETIMGVSLSASNQKTLYDNLKIEDILSSLGSTNLNTANTIIKVNELQNDSNTFKELVGVL